MRFIPTRKMSWTIIVFSVLMLIWAISAGGASTDCTKDAYTGACKAGEAVGRGIAVTLIVFIWFFGFVVLSIVWFMTKPKHRTCPTCGHDVKKGLTACKNCGHDFAASATPVAIA